MKIHISCPGAWKHGLDSPERGEGRWAQNLARLFAKRGHTVYANSAGSPTWGAAAPVPGVVLLDSNNEGAVEECDLFIDSSWYEGKRRDARAKKYFHVHWSPEHYVTRKKLPDNHYLLYPYAESGPGFLQDSNINKDSTFFLPTPICEKFSGPGFNRKSIMWSTKFFGMNDVIKHNVSTALEALKEILDKDETLRVTWMFPNEWLSGGFSIPFRPGVDQKMELSPYFMVCDAVSACKLVVSVNLPSSVLEAAAYGSAISMWKTGSFFSDTQEPLGLVLEDLAPKNRIIDVFNTLLYDEGVYKKVVVALQERLSDHTEEGVMKRFDHILSKVF